MRSANPSFFSKENISCLPRRVLYHISIFYVNQTNSVLNFARGQTPADDTCVYWKQCILKHRILRKIRATFLSLSEEKKATSAGLKRLRRSRCPLAYSLHNMFLWSKGPIIPKLSLLPLLIWSTVVLDRHVAHWIYCNVLKYWDTLK